MRYQQTNYVAIIPVANAKPIIFLQIPKDYFEIENALFDLNPQHCES